LKMQLKKFKKQKKQSINLPIKMINISQKVIEIFKTLDLNEVEIKIYLALLENDKLGITGISESINLSRTNVYNYVEKIEEMGLISKVPDSATLKYQAVSPDKILEVLKTKEDDIKGKIAQFKKILPELKNLESEKNPTQVKMYEGEEGLARIIEKLLKDESLKIIFHSDIKKPFFPELLNEFLKYSREKKQNIQEIRSHLNKNNDYKPTEKNPNHSLKVAPKSLNLKSDMIITPNRVLYVSYQGRFLGVEVSNKFMTETQNSIFDMIWDNI